MRTLVRPLLFVLSFVVLTACAPKSYGQANVPMYGDYLLNGFQDWSFGTRNFSNHSPVHGGTNSIAIGGSSSGASWHQSPFDSSPYASLSFWAIAGTNQGQILSVKAYLNDVAQSPYSLSPALSSNTWQQYIVPLSVLNAASKTNVTRFDIFRGSGTVGTFYVDDVQLNAAPAPAVVNISVNATQAVRSVDSRWFGVNTATWDGNLDNATTISLLKEAGLRMLRFPGGSTSDQYHWLSNTVISSRQGTWFTNFAHVATNIGAQAFITVNYGSGTPGEAAAWVSYSNQTNKYGFLYWEIGNENYGTWETDSNNVPPYAPNDGWTYATRAADYYHQMKAADPNIKVGIVVNPGEDGYANGNTTHPATNLLNSSVHYGWTPVVLATLKSLGVTPDFAVDHRYPEYTDVTKLPNCPDSDPLLLQTAGAWASDAADLRYQITAYFGAGGENIELVSTENNADAGPPGRQATSLVNALYYAESLGQIMKTELNAFVWWDLHNSSTFNGAVDSSLYGWRNFGDFGMLSGSGTRYPSFYAAKLMQYFARPGDTVLNPSSDYLLVSPYAARLASGALSLLVVNRDTLSNFTAQVSINGFVPSSVATLRSFGVPQDDAARTNAPVSARDIVTTNFPAADASFTYTFPRLSLTLFTLVPAPPALVVVPPAPQPGGQVIIELQGQPGVRYYVQSSPDLSSWTTISTNTLVGNSVDLTYPVASDSGMQFWRAVWQP